jgi:aminopeptidase
VRDPRVSEYARLIVERSIDAQPGWQVLVLSSPAARPLVEEVVRLLGRRGAYPLVRLSFAMEQIPFRNLWAQEAPLELLRAAAPADREAWRQADAWINIGAPENTRDGSDLSPEREALLDEAGSEFLARRLNLEIPWVTCRFPTPALAQDAGMTTAEFEDFLYGSILLDWDAEGERMARFKERFDAADEVRIVGDETDIRLSIAGRSMKVDAGGANIPGGEFFGCPVEDSAEGVIAFTEFPAVYAGREVNGIRLRFEAGAVVDASAETNEGYLVEMLDSDAGARRLGELGIGCNPGITRYMRNTLFDEKIDGTVHLALGNGMPDIGGTNESRIHWDIVKDLRMPGTRIELDGEVVQQDGAWLL